MIRLTPHNLTIIRTRGTSLFETVIYIGLFTMIAIFVINALISSFRLFYTISLDHEIAVSGRTAMETISREVQNADSIDVGSSTFDSSPGILQLNALDGGGIPYTTTFQVASSTLDLSIDSISIGALTSDAVTVTSLIFRRIVTTNSTEGIRVELTLEGERYGRTRTEDFQTTVMVRSSY